MSILDIDIGLNPSIMTPKQVAGYLQISPRTVYSHWEQLGGFKIGRTLRFRKEILN
ncbi:MAG: helix-turn-helix domain-containing protein, partial [Spirochaetes bacterium]|nr:helix-turn-helix domain-containing protein [Spirochaetota bacterium]